MNFTEVSERPETIELIGKVLESIGLAEPAESYEGDDAYSIRNAAAKALSSAIQEQHDTDPKAIAAPDKELCQKAIGAARGVEKDRTKVALTQTVIEMIVIGHVWIKLDGGQSKHGALSRILDVMDRGMSAKQHRSFFNSGGCDDCDDCQCATGGCSGGGCGGCGP